MWRSLNMATVYPHEALRAPPRVAGRSALASSGDLQHVGHKQWKGVAPMTEKLGLILLDVTPGSDGEFDRSFLERSGHEVVVCHGPEHDELCPLLAGTGCDKVDRAHGIVFALDLDQAQHREILQRYRDVTRPEVPIRAVVQPGQRGKYADLLGEVEVWEHEPTAAELDGFASNVEATDRSGG